MQGCRKVENKKMAKDTPDKYEPRESLGSSINVEKLELKTESITKESKVHYIV